MFDLGWIELLLVGITALIVVGPKDLPGMFKKVGFFVSKARKMAREFQYNMEIAADDTGIKEAADVLKDIDQFKSPKKIREKAVKNILKDSQISEKSKVTKLKSKEKKEKPDDNLKNEILSRASKEKKLTKKL
jgi:sec-independent protein translocase protein TatB